MTTYIRTDLNYSYEPTDFFELATSVDSRIGSVAADSGKIVVSLAHPTDQVDRTFANAVTAAVRAIFQAQQILVHRQFELRGPNVTQYRPDGLRDIVMLADPGKLEIRGNPVDFRLTDPVGNVVSDSRAERIAEQSGFVRKVAAKIPDSTLQRMLESYGKAVSDPANELVHLYEIRDAAVQHYGSENVARSTLQISKSDWSKLGRLANNEPLQEGRHRGRQLAGLRNATKAELVTARTIGRRILESFAQLL